MTAFTPMAACLGRFRWLLIIYPHAPFSLMNNPMLINGLAAWVPEKKIPARAKRATNKSLTGNSVIMPGYSHRVPWDK